METPLQARVYCSSESCTSIATQQCSRCQLRWYCSKECQRKDWRRHKPECYYEKPTAERGDWWCDALDANRTLCRVLHQTPASHEKSRLVTLLQSDFVRRVRALATYTCTLDDATLNSSLDALRSGTFTEVALLALYPPALVGTATGCRVTLMLFWAMLMCEYAPGYDQASRELSTQCALGLYYCNVNPRIYFASGNSTALVSFPVMTGREYTVTNTVTEGFGALWSLDQAMGFCNLTYLFCYVTREPGDEKIAHLFLLRVLGKRAFLLQSVYGYYSVADWLNYESELSVRADYVDSMPPGWHSTLEPRPKWRRLLKLHEVSVMARDIDAMVGDQVDPQCYARLTGIVSCDIPQMRLMILRQCY